MARGLFVVGLLLVLAFTPLSCESDAVVVRVASKKFTESVVLGELAKHLVRSTGTDSLHQSELGGTRIVFEALRVGEIDIYPEYTGTISEELFAGKGIRDEAAMREALAEQGIGMTGKLGFNNRYALGMRREVAERLGIEKVSDLVKHPKLALRFSNEFMERSDCWPGLREHYGLPQQDVKGLDHDVAYRQLNVGGAGAIDVYTTDAKIAQYDIRVLDDDRGYFPRYDALFLYRLELEQQAPGVVAAVRRVTNRISDAKMIELNERAVLQKVSESQVAADFLKEALGLEVAVRHQSLAEQLWKHTFEHVDMVRQSLIAAILVSIPLGVIAAKWPRIGQVILGIVGVIQTIPALALLVILIEPVHWLGLNSIGSGSATAVIALFLYSLLPIVRNTYSGLKDIPNELLESAEALGLPPLSRLWLIELPLASRTILAGIKTAAVINIGFATLGALIGAGGYGQPILTGIRLDDTRLILQGAVPAALLALLVQGLFELSERKLVPKGLRLKPAE